MLNFIYRPHIAWIIIGLFKYRWNLMQSLVCELIGNTLFQKMVAKITRHTSKVVVFSSVAGWSCGDWQYVIGIVQLLGLTAASGSHIIDLLGSKAPPRKAAQALPDLCLNYSTPWPPFWSKSRVERNICSKDFVGHRKMLVSLLSCNRNIGEKTFSRTVRDLQSLPAG